MDTLLTAADTHEYDRYWAASCCLRPKTLYVCFHHGVSDDDDCLARLQMRLDEFVAVKVLRMYVGRDDVQLEKVTVPSLHLRHQ